MFDYVGAPEHFSATNNEASYYMNQNVYVYIPSNSNNNGKIMNNKNSTSKQKHGKFIEIYITYIQYVK